MTPSKTIIIGGSRGIGLALARMLDAEGEQLVLTGRNRERLDLAREQLGMPVQTMNFDMSDEAATLAALDAVGPFDHLVLCGSDAVAWGSLQEVDAARLRAGLDGKLVGFWNCVRIATANPRRLAENGSITLITGAAGRTAMPGTSALAAVNGAITQAAMTWAVELAPRRVNVVSPGLTATHAYDGMPADQRAAFYAQRGAGLPVGRVAAPEEIASTLQHVIRNRYMTGAVVDIDGGARLKFN